MAFCYFIYSLVQVVSSLSVEVPHISSTHNTEFTRRDVLFIVSASVVSCALVLSLCICCRERNTSDSLSQHSYMQNSSGIQNKCLLQMASSHPATPGFEQIQINWDDYDHLETMFLAVEEELTEQRTNTYDLSVYKKNDGK